MRLFLHIITAVAAIGDFWREVNDATSSKAVLYNGMSKSKGNDCSLEKVISKKSSCATSETVGNVETSP